MCAQEQNLIVSRGTINTVSKHTQTHTHTYTQKKMSITTTAQHWMYELKKKMDRLGQPRNAAFLRNKKPRSLLLLGSIFSRQS